MGEFDVGEDLCCGGDVLWVPETENESRSESGLVVGVGGDDRVHEVEKSGRVIVDFNIDIEEDVRVFWLHQKIDRFAESGDLLLRELVRKKLIETTVVVLSLNATGSVRSTVCRTERGKLSVFLETDFDCEVV